MTTVTRTLKAPFPDRRTSPQTEASPLSVPEPVAPDLGWEHHGHQGDWAAFLVWVACFLLMAFMLAYDMIASILGL
jgi:hypothetical protein